MVWREAEWCCQGAGFLLNTFRKPSTKLQLQYTITRKEFFCFLVHKSCLGTATATYSELPSPEKLWCVRSSWEGWEILAVSSLPFHPLRVTTSWVQSSRAWTPRRENWLTLWEFRSTSAWEKLPCTLPHPSTPPPLNQHQFMERSRTYNGSVNLKGIRPSNDQSFYSEQWQASNICVLLCFFYYRRIVWIVIAFSSRFEKLKNYLLFHLFSASSAAHQ